MNVQFDLLSDPTLLTEFVTQIGYVASTTDENGVVTPNPVSEADFATQFLQDSVASYIKTYEINNAVKQATSDAEDTINTKIAQVQSAVLKQGLGVKSL